MTLISAVKSERSTEQVSDCWARGLDYDHYLWRAGRTGFRPVSQPVFDAICNALEIEFNEVFRRDENDTEKLAL